MNIKQWAILGLLAATSFPLAACERREGGLERTGEKIGGERGEDVGEELEDTGKDLKEAGKEATEK